MFSAIKSFQFFDEKGKLARGYAEVIKCLEVIELDGSKSHTLKVRVKLKIRWRRVLMVTGGKIVSVPAPKSVDGGAGVSGVG